MSVTSSKQAFHVVKPRSGVLSEPSGRMLSVTVFLSEPRRFAAVTTTGKSPVTGVSPDMIFPFIVSPSGRPSIRMLTGRSPSTGIRQMNGLSGEPPYMSGIVSRAGPEKGSACAICFVIF